VITEDGRQVAHKATAELNAARFGMGALEGSDLHDLFRILRGLRLDAGDFTS